MTHPIVFPMRRRGLTGATGAQGAGVATLEPRIDKIEQAGLNDVYVHAVNGSDSNSGASSSVPVQTATKVFQLLKNGQYNRVRLMSDLDWDYFVDTTLSGFVRFSRSGQSGNAKLRFVNSINLPSRSGGFLLRGDLSVETSYVDIDLASNVAPYPVFWPYGTGSLRIWMWQPTITSVGSNTALLLGNYYASRILAYFNSPTMTNMGGKLFSGISAGANPNTRLGVETNWTTG